MKKLATESGIKPVASGPIPVVLSTKPIICLKSFFSDNLDDSNVPIVDYIPDHLRVPAELAPLNPEDCPPNMLLVRVKVRSASVQKDNSVMLLGGLRLCNLFI